MFKHKQLHRLFWFVISICIALPVASHYKMSPIWMLLMYSLNFVGWLEGRGDKKYEKK